MRAYTMMLGFGLLALPWFVTACGETNSVVGTNVNPVEGESCPRVGRTAPAADGCNECECSAAGEWVCTDLACPERCEAGATRLAADGCNECECGADGTWSCTDRACTGSCVYGEQSHPNGSSFRAADGCNECSCADGSVVCTDVACGNECSSGQTTTRDCNTCICLNGGWSCTARACGSCTAGETRLAADGCNECTCGADGTWSCTQIGCGGERLCDEVSDCGIVDVECEDCGDTTLCPSMECIAGRCALVTPACEPQQCGLGLSCPELDAECLDCADGSRLCPEYLCFDGECKVAQFTCPAAR